MDGDTVELTSDDGLNFKAKVVEVVDVSRKNDPSGLIQFSVLLEAKKENLKPQGTFSLNHGKEGKCELFLVPIVSQNENVLYEATFTRMA